ncbi:hypothetical protein HRbin30_01538 [bacterium HR30]|nr:hypothetical protein HRbin30_01538 [bacterium HR30]
MAKVLLNIPRLNGLSQTLDSREFTLDEASLRPARSDTRFGNCAVETANENLPYFSKEPRVVLDL